ncbi:MAG: hypothetical protein KC426_09500 [Oceanospirillaceae bacterium]|nr:hypothetical protein [Oceanospirillaceae bacterium]
MNYLKGIITIMLFGLMQACSSLSPLDVSYSGLKNQAFTEALAEQDWIRDEYATYQKRKGYKAFAISTDAGGTIFATGFADDKITVQAAYDEALRMCRHYSEGDGQCSVIDEQDSHERIGLTQKQIDTAPKELIAHRDIVRYVQYKKASAPKAFAVAACSGQSFWLANQASQANAEQDVLSMCETYRHASDPCCTMLESE